MVKYHMPYNDLFVFCGRRRRDVKLAYPCITRNICKACLRSIFATKHGRV